jgi:4-amino-4-deoxychorismate lyase
VSGLLGSWIDGAAGTSIPIDDRGLQYGDGLFETMKVRGGRVRFLEAHLARLTLGCERLGLPMPDGNQLRGEIAMAVAHGRGDAILKLIVTRGSGPRGYAARGSFTPRRIMSLHAAPVLVVPDGGVALRMSKLTLTESPMLAGIKHLNRLDNVLAASEPAHEQVFDSLLLDASGLLVSGTMCNVFLVRQGRVITPTVERAGVAGVMRGIVLRECAKLGLDGEVRAVPAAELLAADEVFVTNARIGVVPARSVGEHVLTMNGIATRLASHVEALDA